MQDKLEKIKKQFEKELKEVKDFLHLDELDQKFFSRKSGEFTSLMKGLGELAEEKRKEFGKLINETKAEVEGLFAEKKNEMEMKKMEGIALQEKIDVSQPALGESGRGHLHPNTQIQFALEDLFTSMGFMVLDGPELESDYYNFTALNIPLDHPSREAFDTFYTESGHLLRSQTSTVQIRVMQGRKPPLRILAPGRVYRPDAVDASHSFMFHQIEGLMIDGEITFSDLKGVLHLFLRELFGSETKIRFRPHFFPFTEPSVEVDIRWQKGWLEILGAGCVHPNVFDAVGYDSKKVQGFAFGLGVERIAMLRHGIPDIRLFYENDLRFLRQFS